MGAALMRSGWLKEQFSLRHYRRTGALLVAAEHGGQSAGNIRPVVSGLGLSRWCAFLLQAPRELSAPPRAIGYAALALGLLAAQLTRFRLVGAIACVRTHGADQLPPAADPDLHHPVLSSWAVYALRSSAAAGLCPPHLGR